MRPLAQNTIPILIAVIIIAASFFVGFSMGTNQVPRAVPSGLLSERGDIDFTTFWDVWDAINKKYVTREGPENQEKVWSATSGLVKSLGDPYSVFFPPKEAENFASEVRGNFGGVGIEIGMEDDILTIIAPLKNTPAEKAGLLPGDKIIKIDDDSAFGITIDESVDLIRGEIGEPVLLTVVREGEAEPIEIEVIRDIIQIPVIETENRDDGVFIIRLFTFTGTSPALFRDALREFIETGYDKLVLDLRNNPGGFLESATDIASWFLPAGKVVVEERGREEGTEKFYRSRGYNIFTEELKFVILINRGSASASEILAGALSEYGIATLVGEKSFGKGSVQELIALPKGTSLKLTIAKWYTPHGASISQKGIVPEIEVEYTREDAEADIDPQLDKAIEVLHAM